VIHTVQKQPARDFSKYVFFFSKRKNFAKILEQIKFSRKNDFSLEHIGFSRSVMVYITWMYMNEKNTSLYAQEFNIFLVSRTHINFQEQHPLRTHPNFQEQHPLEHIKFSRCTNFPNVLSLELIQFSRSQNSHFFLEHIDFSISTTPF